MSDHAESFGIVRSSIGVMERLQTEFLKAPARILYYLLGQAEPLLWES